MTPKHCPECGSQVVPDAKFCPECGTPLQKAATAGAAKGSKAKQAKSNSARDILIIVGALVIVAAAYFFLRERPEPPAPQTNQQAGQPAGQTDGENPHGDMSGMNMAMLDSLPADFETRVQMGNQFMDQGNFALAAEIYKRALQLNPEAENVRVDYGACLHGMGLPQRALDEFRTVLGKHPKHPIATFNMGIVHYDVQNTDSAKVYFTRYLEIEPSGSAAPNAREFLKQLGG